MREVLVEAYRCPYTGERLSLRATKATDDHEVSEGSLVSESGLVYPVVNGMPHLVDHQRQTFSAEEERERVYYEATARSYDDVLDWLFRSFYEDESAVRSTMIDLLRIAPTHRVLETGAGTCRDTVRIAERLGPQGKLFAQDLSAAMLSIGRDRMEAEMPDGNAGLTEYFVGDAARLPFPDGFFDSAYHFGGLNLFTDKKAALAEMARVVKIGGAVVIGDEGIAPWHRDTEYGAILMNSNRLYTFEPPLDVLPPSARRAGVRWLIGDAFYVIDFTVAEGHPKVDLDLPIKGRRGGTHRTRYFGALEGVTPEAKAMAAKAAEASGVSLHEWLDRAVRSQASDERG